MLIVKKIMACVDLSQYSKETVAYALALARGFQAETVIYNVINSRDVEAVKKASQYYPELIKVDEFLEATKADRRQQISEMLEADFASDKAKVAVLLGVGVPYAEILQAIEKEQIDLVVLGSKGRTNAVGTLFGSNAEKVFRHSPIPVVSVRNRERSTRMR
jgi:nucleotide-binding universal stress UspA family protein